VAAHKVDVEGFKVKVKANALGAYGGATLTFDI
jgi:hypothetical protein